MSWSAFPFAPVIPLASRCTGSLHPLPSLVNHFPAVGPSSGDRLGQYTPVSHVISPSTLTVRSKDQVDQVSGRDDLVHHYSLGSAYVDTDRLWSWSENSHAMAHPLPIGENKTLDNQVPVEPILHVPASIRQMMAQIALASGRSESDLWIEAADAWLNSHTCDDEPLPPAPAAALAIPSGGRSWDMIDDLLATLRTPIRVEMENESAQAA